MLKHLPQKQTNLWKLNWIDLLKTKQSAIHPSHFLPTPNYHTTTSIPPQPRLPTKRTPEILMRRNFTLSNFSICLINRFLFAIIFLSGRFADWWEDALGFLPCFWGAVWFRRLVGWGEKGCFGGGCRGGICRGCVLGLRIGGSLLVCGGHILGVFLVCEGGYAWSVTGHYKWSEEIVLDWWMYAWYVNLIEAKDVSRGEIHN